MSIITKANGITHPKPTDGGDVQGYQYPYHYHAHNCRHEHYPRHIPQESRSFRIKYQREISLDMYFEPHSRISIVNGNVCLDSRTHESQDHFSSQLSGLHINKEKPVIFDVNSFFA